MPNRRMGLTLIEILVVLAIIAVLLGLLLPAVSAIRQSAMQVQTSNQMRQVALAVHSYSAASGGRIPDVVGNPDTACSGIARLTGQKSVFTALLPQLEADSRTARGDELRAALHRLLISPADPSTRKPMGTYSSIAANACAFAKARSLDRSFPDGLSNTFAFGKHYASCSFASFDPRVFLPGLGDERPATFAHGEARLHGYTSGIMDLAPIPIGRPPRWRSRTGATFQHVPAVSDCRGDMAQGLHPGGMLAAMFDGSVRMISPNIDTYVYWGAVTPNKGEPVGEW